MSTYFVIGASRGLGLELVHQVRWILKKNLLLEEKN